MKILRPFVGLSLLAALAATVAPQSVSAQTAPTDDPATAPPVKKKYNPYGTPLDTILSTRLWTDVPEAKEFVRQTRPDPKTLSYAPLTGKDPARPKPRNLDGVAALEEELQNGAAKNEAAKDDVIKAQTAPVPVPAKPKGRASAKHKKLVAKPKAPAPLAAK
jgi:hypothetical protein